MDFNYEEYEENTVADVVRNLLTMQMPMANIIKATGLTLEEIRIVKEDIEMEAIAKNLIEMKIIMCLMTKIIKKFLLNVVLVTLMKV